MNKSIVTQAPRGFHRPVPAVDYLGSPLGYLNGPSRDTGTELDQILSAFSDEDGFTVTVAGVELPLSEARRVHGLLTDVIEAVGAAAAEFEHRGI